MLPRPSFRAGSRPGIPEPDPRYAARTRLPPNPNQPTPPSDDSSEPVHHFAPDIPTPPPPPPVPELLTRPVHHPAPPLTPPKPTSKGDTARAWGIAMDFVVTVIGMALLGYFADKYLNSSPTWTIVGLSAGFAFALYKIIRRTLADEKREAAARDASRQPPGPMNPDR